MNTQSVVFSCNSSRGQDIFCGQLPLLHGYVGLVVSTVLGVWSGGKALSFGQWGLRCLDVPPRWGVASLVCTEGAGAGSLDTSPGPSIAPTTVTLGQDLPPGAQDLPWSRGGQGV